MMKLTVQQVKETRNYVCYETPSFDMVFRSNLYAIKLWIPKTEFGPEANEIGIWPNHIEVGILDDTDNLIAQGSEISYTIPVKNEMTLGEIIRRANGKTN